MLGSGIKSININNEDAVVKNIGAVIITYFPVVESLQKLIHLLASACTYCVIVDNTPGENIGLSNLESQFPNLFILLQKNNLGIAKAQNIGVDYLFERCNFFVFFDQDSEIKNATISQLYNGFLALSKAGYKAGAIGPELINKVSGKPYINKGGNLADFENIKEVPYLPGSGTFFSRESWLKTGILNETLFIDGVDLEWCWRGSHNSQLRYFILEDAPVYHSVGKDKKLFGIFRIKTPEPVRCYYLYRNYFYLLKRSYVPLYWKFSSGIKYFIKLLVLPVFLDRKKEYLSNIFNGIKDGVKLL